MTSAYAQGRAVLHGRPRQRDRSGQAHRGDVQRAPEDQVYGAGELIPALEGFDAVRAGTVEMNHANSYFWTGKTFAAQYFTAVPFGLNFQGMNGWLYDGGGMRYGTRSTRRSAWSPFPAATPACR